MGVSPTRVRRLRARRARRRAVVTAVASLVAVSAGALIVSGSNAPAVRTAASRGESRPGVQGSTSVRTAPKSAIRAPHPVPSMFSVDTASVARVVEPVVGVWVAARRGLGALGALKLSAEAAPSAIPPSWLALHRPIAVSVEMQGKDLDVSTKRGDRPAAPLGHGDRARRR